MDRTTRYLIILLGFVVFLALAPIIVLYVTGTNFNLENRNYGNTGILDISTEPSGAQVSIDGIEANSTPTTVRFIKQGNYTITVSKEGYRTWQKRLFIESGQVTYASGSQDAIKLLPDASPEQLTSDPVLAATSVGNKIAYITTGNVLKTISADGGTPTTYITLPQSVQTMERFGQSDILLIQYQTGEKTAYSLDTKKILQLPTRFKNAQELVTTSTGTLLARVGNTLWSGNWNNNTTTQLLTDVLAVTAKENAVYVASQSPTTPLAVYTWDGQGLSNPQTLLTTPFVDTNGLSLLITDRKELFVKTNTSLYRVNNTLETLGTQVAWVTLNPARSELVFRTPTEVLFYNFVSAKAELLYRTTETVLDGLVKPERGHGFIVSSTQVLGIEIDNRDRQNTYPLLQSTGITQMFITDNDQKLIVVSDGKLFSIAIQN